MIALETHTIQRAPLLFRKEILGKLAAINVAILCFAFPLTATVPLFLNMPSYTFNLLLRALYLGLSLYLVIGASFHPSAWRFGAGGWFLLAFWLIYSFRLVYDIEILGVVARGGAFRLYGFAFGNCFFGAVATLLTLRWASFRTLRFVTVGVISLAAIGILSGAVFQYQTLNPLEMAGRARFTIDNGTERGRDVLNPITISRTGQLMVAAFTYLYLAGKLVSRRALWAVPGIIIGVVVLLIGGSRGPFLGTVITILFLIGVRLYQMKKTSLNLLRVFMLFSVSAVGLVHFVLKNISDSRLLVLQRLQTLGEGGEKEVRSYQWESAWQQFMDHPVLGDRYLERAFNFYPHNIYLESLMATGVVGSFFFFGMLMVAGWMVINDVRMGSPRILFAVLLFAILLSSFTSGSLFKSVILWGGLSLYFSARIPLNAQRVYHE